MGQAILANPNSL